MIFKYLDTEGKSVVVALDPNRCELLSSEFARLDGRLTPYAVTATSEEMQVWWKGRVYRIELPSHSRRKSKGGAAGAGGQDLIAQMPGTILKILVEVGDRVTLRQPLVLMESMKMEMTLESPGLGTVSKIYFAKGERVDRGALLLQLDILAPLESQT